MDLEACRSCKGTLEPGPAVSRSGKSKRFACVIQGIPARVCPKGCAGQYWPHPDLGVEVFDGLLSDEKSTAARKLTLFGFKQICRECGEKLADAGKTAALSVSVPLRGGGALELSITGPCLSCAACGRDFLANPDKHDPLGVELQSLVSAVLCDSLIHE